MPNLSQAAIFRTSALLRNSLKPKRPHKAPRKETKKFFKEHLYFKNVNTGTYFVRYINPDDLVNMTRLRTDVHDKLLNNVGSREFHRRFVDRIAEHKCDASAHKELEFYKILWLCIIRNIFIYKLTY